MRPIEKSAASTSMCLPLSRSMAAPWVAPLAPPSSGRIRWTVSPRRKVTRFWRIWCMSSSTISWSQNSSGRALRSMSVTSTPSSANIEAYSMPITPPPMTASERGSLGSRMMSSLVRMVSWSASTGGGAGTLPQAMRMCSAVAWRSRGPPLIEIRCGSRNRAVPAMRSMPLRESWRATTSSSRSITVFTRWSSSFIVGRGRSMGVPRESIGTWVSESTASRKVLLGTVPVWRQTPPTMRDRSTRPTRLPSFAACTAARCPAGPLPRTRRS